MDSFLYKIYKICVSYIGLKHQGYLIKISIINKYLFINSVI